MKKFLAAVFLLAMLAPLTYAAASTKPTVTTPNSPVNAAKATISGTSSSGAKIIVTGGPYEIAPVYADSTGKFSVTVALTQETSNLFHIQSQTTGNDPSDEVDVTIVESDDEAAAYETATGTDRTAPGAPTLEESSAETTASTYTIKGSGEAKASVIISGTNDATGTVDSEGQFSVEVELKGSGETDTFSVSLKDAAGNVSSASKITIVSSATVSTDDTSDDSTSEEVSFPDTTGHWAEDYIKTLYSKGIIGGYANGNFGPDDSVTRAQILKMALLAFDHDASSSSSDFSDVLTDSWYVDYVSYAKSQGIVDGYSDGTFKPDNYVDRAGAIKIILLAAGRDVGTSTASNFSDVSSSDWFATYTAYAKANGIIGGYSDGTYKGGQNISRAEVAKILAVMIE